MSIYNMIASIVGGAGGGEMEQGTATNLTANSTISFSETHSAAPDVFLLTCDYNDLTGSNDMAVLAYINGTNNFAENWAWTGWMDGEIAGYKTNGSPYTDAIYDGDVPNYMTASGITIPYFSGLYPNYDVTYNWYALWASGSGGGGGGGGGTAKNVQTNQTTSRTSSTSLNSVNSLTCSTAGTYDVYWTCTRSSTSGTWSSQLYLGGTAYGSEQTSWSNHVQTVHLSNVSISANQTVAVYVKARGTNYYGYAPQLTIVQS